MFREQQAESSRASSSSDIPPSTGPSSTFSINFELPIQPEVDENFETLRGNHARFIENLFPSEAEDEAWLFATSVTGDMQTPPSSTTNSQSIQDLHTKPTFNLSSAQHLLHAFRSMLSQLPCILLPADTSVPQLAATQPFVLLAILAAASGSRTLQGHSLYDEEFRKVLGLKFVTGGERSMELLQGILIYCCWYPFHLQPRNKTVLQYMRFAADLVHDLELDQELPPHALESKVTDQQLDGIRAYLAYYYAASLLGIAWRKHKNFGVPFITWTATCCDILERNAKVYGDSVLASLTRLASITKDASGTMHDTKNQPAQQARLILMGLETQVKEAESRIPHSVASSTTIRMEVMFVNIYLNGGNLLRIPRPSKSQIAACISLPPTEIKLRDCVPVLKQYLDFVSSLHQETVMGFSIVDWNRLILLIILAIRLSFPLLECPDFDPAWARSQIRMNEFLDKFCQTTDLTPATKKVDILSASRVVFAVVRDKYNREVQRQNAKMGTPVDSTPSATMRCPMLDGSMDQYISSWGATFDTNSRAAMPMAGPNLSAGSPQVFHDLWATMTMGWANDDQDTSEQC
ncbi:hypothetical protein PT974_01229 [Cladobotryum mycophilum]|uniref:Transcription factor domain-containing protein n=1 Tax=Cladobotryum mycophilum TaxID=491253 RepID=A0ABR0T331_9HYPO